MIHSTLGNSKDMTAANLAAQRDDDDDAALEYQRRIDEALADAETEAYLRHQIAQDEYMAVRESMYGAW